MKMVELNVGDKFTFADGEPYYSNLIFTVLEQHGTLVLATNGIVDCYIEPWREVNLEIH